MSIHTTVLIRRGLRSVLTVCGAAMAVSSGTGEPLEAQTDTRTDRRTTVKEFINSRRCSSPRVPLAAGMPSREASVVQLMEKFSFTHCSSYKARSYRLFLKKEK